MILLGCSLVDAHYSCLLDQAQPSYTYMCMFLIITIIIYIYTKEYYIAYALVCVNQQSWPPENTMQHYVRGLSHTHRHPHTLIYPLQYR